MPNLGGAEAGTTKDVNVGAHGCAPGNLAGHRLIYEAGRCYTVT
jgi:hypothetical protein